MARDTWESLVRYYPPGSARRKILEFIAACGSVACTPADAIDAAGVSPRDRARGLGFVGACVQHGYLRREGTGIVAAHLAHHTIFEEIVRRAFRDAV